MRQQKSFVMTVFVLCLLTACWLLLAGCTGGGKESKKVIPRTPKEAGIAVLDSSNCESCHLSAEAISAFEKPKTAEAPKASGG